MASCSCSRIDYSYGVAGSRVVPTTTIRPLPSAVIFWGDPVGALAALLNNKVSPGDAADRLGDAAGGPWTLIDTTVSTPNPSNFNATLQVRSAQESRTWVLGLSDVDGQFVVMPLNPSTPSGASTLSPSP